MQKTIITTVGTSLLTNYSESLRKEKKQDEDYQDAYDNLKDLPFFEHGLNDKKITKVLERVGSIKNKLNTFSNCAEISSITAIENELRKSLKEGEELTLTIHLLCTDTILSPLCAEVIAEYFEKEENKEVKESDRIIITRKVIFEKPGERQTTIIEKIKENDFSSSHIIKDLRVDSAGNYEKGFMNLIEQLDKLNLTKNDILNITGGYKAIIPILTLYGQLKEIPLKYIFNESKLNKTNELVTVGNLPINFDYSIFEDNYLAFESIKPDKQIQNLPSIEEFKKNLEDEKVFNDLKNSFLIKIENEKVSLSVLGRMLYKSYENSLKEDGFNMSNLVGKVMEIKVFEFFNQQFPKQTELGKKIGKSDSANSYDIDVFVETDEQIWAIEVKPEGVKVLNDGNKIDRNSLQNKFENGAFKNVLDKYPNKTLNFAIFVYHHKEPNKFQKENFKNLRKLESNPCKNFTWFWMKPPKNYKGNVNWKLTKKEIKKFNFETETWEDFDFEEIQS